jgi:DNA-binding transcriptional ArsR family regulator
MMMMTMMMMMKKKKKKRLFDGMLLPMSLPFSLFPSFLSRVEELLWILQQQPVYMASLSEILRKNSVEARFPDR